MSGAADSAAASRVPSGGPAVGSGGPAPRAAAKRSRAYRIGGALLGVVVIVAIFVGVIPQFASYHGAWTALAKMSPAWWVAIAVAAVINLLVVVWPWQAVLPQLRFRHGFMQIQASTAVATTVPAGGALAIGLTYRMFGSFGFSTVAVSTAVVTTGVWNLGFKLGLPIVAVILMAATGHSAGRAVGAALGGVAVIAVCGTVLWLVFRDEASARRVGRLGDRILNWVLHFAGKSEPHRIEHAALHFREQTTDAVHQRGWRLTAAVAACQFAVFVLVVFCVRAAGIPAWHGQLPGGPAVLRRRPAGRGPAHHPGGPGQRGRRVHRHADRLRGDLQPRPGRRPGVAGHHHLSADPHRHRDLPAVETRPGQGHLQESRR